MNHGNGNAKDRVEALRASCGATGRFPDAKIDPQDEGELQFTVGVKGDQVVMHFGKPVMWLTFSSEQAVAIARSMIEKADQITARRAIVP